MDITSYILGKKAGGGEPTPINLQSKEIEITENTEETITADTGYDGLSSVKVTTNVPSQEIDWSDIGYSDEPIIIDYLHSSALQLLNSWDARNPHTFTGNTSIVSAPTLDVSGLDKASVAGMFKNCSNLVTVSNTFSSNSYKEWFSGCTSLVAIDISNFSTEDWTLGVSGAFARMFEGCTNLKHIDFGNFEKFDPTKTNNIYMMFNNSLNFDNDTLNQILKMCILVTDNIDVSSRKLSTIGITNSIYLATIPNLSNYNDFIAAGWTLN